MKLLEALKKGFIDSESNNCLDDNLLPKILSNDIQNYLSGSESNTFILQNL